MSQQGPIDLNTVVTTSRELVSSDLDGEVVMMSIENGSYYGLDPIGSRIWRLLEEPKTVAALCQILIQEFAVEQGQCEADVLAFLNELMTDGLVLAHASTD